MEQSAKTNLVLLPYRFTLFSNAGVTVDINGHVLLPYRFTLFSNAGYTRQGCFSVLLPYRFTLFSNNADSDFAVFRFYYLIDLHYSQTLNCFLRSGSGFYYLIDLHYSQTTTLECSAVTCFTTL